MSLKLVSEQLAPGLGLVAPIDAPSGGNFAMPGTPEAPPAAPPDIAPTPTLTSTPATAAPPVQATQVMQVQPQLAPPPAGTAAAALGNMLSAQGVPRGASPTISQAPTPQQSPTIMQAPQAPAIEPAPLPMAPQVTAAMPDGKGGFIPDFLPGDPMPPQFQPSPLPVTPEVREVVERLTTTAATIEVHSAPLEVEVTITLRGPLSEVMAKLAKLQ